MTMPLFRKGICDARSFILVFPDQKHFLSENVTTREYFEESFQYAIKRNEFFIDY